MLKFYFIWSLSGNFGCKYTLLSWHGMKIQETVQLRPCDPLLVNMKNKKKFNPSSDDTWGYLSAKSSCVHCTCDHTWPVKLVWIWITEDGPHTVKWLYKTGVKQQSAKETIYILHQLPCAQFFKFHLLLDCTVAKEEVKQRSR